MIEKNWKEIIKPSKLEVKEESTSENTSTIIAEPLERGYGVTIGNALRRILLSSLQGSAITCLLYTSPSPRDNPASRMPSSA